jgi:hypothetical protein
MYYAGREARPTRGPILPGQMADHAPKRQPEATRHFATKTASFSDDDASGGERDSRPIARPAANGPWFATRFGAYDLDTNDVPRTSRLLVEIIKSTKHQTA